MTIERKPKFRYRLEFAVPCTTWEDLEAVEKAVAKAIRETLPDASYGWSREHEKEENQ